MTEKPTSVTIVGLLPIQADKLRKEFGDRFELDFVRSEAPPAQIRATAASSDYVILMRKFIPHDAQNVLRDHEGLIFCNGGKASAALKLEELLNGS